MQKCQQILAQGRESRNAQSRTYCAGAERRRPSHRETLTSGMMLWVLRASTSAFEKFESGEVPMDSLDPLFGKKKDVPGEFDNSALVRAMENIAANDNPENRQKLYEAFLASMLFIPVPEIPQEMRGGLQTREGLQTLQAGTQVQIVARFDANQVRCTVAFTDLEALRNWDPHTPYVGLKAVDLFRVVVNTDIQDIAINPFDPIRKVIRAGGRIKRAELEQLANGNIPTNAATQQLRLPANEQVFIGRPANPPSAAIQEALRKRLLGYRRSRSFTFFRWQPSRVEAVRSSELR